MAPSASEMRGDESDTGLLYWREEFSGQGLEQLLETYGYTGALSIWARWREAPCSRAAYP